jgi:ornithine--oxo-acid transaminase
MVVLAKALSGGLIPVGAVLVTQDVHKSVFSSLSRAFIHASTFGENSLAMRAGLATLDVLEREELGRRATDLGERLRTALTHRLASFEMVEGVRGLGLLNGIAFRAPRGLRLKTLYHGFAKVHPGMFGQMLVSRMFTSHDTLTQMCGNNYMVIKVAPPLVTSEEQLATFVESMVELVKRIHSGFSFWREGLAMLPRAVRI